MALSEVPAKRNRDKYRKYRRDRLASDPEFRAKSNARVAKWAAKPESKAKVFAWYLKRKYGLTVEQHTAILESQNNRCGICGSTDPGVRTKSKVNRWCVDHCHTTGKVRGILCGPCNIGLGAFHDNVVALRNAIAYIEKTHGDE